MQLFKDSRGWLYAFGFNVADGTENARRLCVKPVGAPHKPEWDWQSFDFDIDPQFVMEARSGAVVAYQPGLCIEIMPTDERVMFRVKILRAS